MPILDYIRNAWTGQITESLRALEHYPSIHDYYAPEYGWFYEGTVQAVAYAHLLQWVNGNERGNYALLMEQPYTNYARDLRADIMTVNRENAKIIVEIKASFDIAAVQQDLEKLEQARSEHVMAFGFALYCVDEDRADVWARDLQAYQSATVQAFPIIRY